MAAKEKVLTSYPNAWEHKQSGTIWESEERDGEIEAYLGDNWQNAAESLPARQEQDLDDKRPFIESELLDVWAHHSLKPQPDSSSIPDTVAANCNCWHVSKHSGRRFAGDHLPDCPARDSSSISTEQTFEEWWELHKYTVFSEPKAAHRDTWNAAKGSTGPNAELAWLEARWKSATTERKDNYANALIVAIAALKSCGGKG